MAKKDQRKEYVRPNRLPLFIGIAIAGVIVAAVAVSPTGGDSNDQKKYPDPQFEDKYGAQAAYEAIFKGDSEDQIAKKRGSWSSFVGKAIADSQQKGKYKCSGCHEFPDKTSNPMMPNMGTVPGSIKGPKLVGLKKRYLPIFRDEDRLRHWLFNKIRNSEEFPGKFTESHGGKNAMPEFPKPKGKNKNSTYSDQEIIYIIEYILSLE